jgi:hypothetical protein
MMRNHPMSGGSGMLCVRPNPASTQSVPAPSTRQGPIQPAMDDPLIANKKTYWESNGQMTRRVRIT